MDQVVKTLIDCDACSDGDQQGDNEAPEVDLATMTKSVLLIGRYTRALHAIEQQHLVGRILQAVEGLGEHRRRSAHAGCDKLDDGDREIARKGDEHGERGADFFFFHASALDYALSHSIGRPEQGRLYQRVGRRLERLHTMSSVRSTPRTVARARGGNRRLAIST